MHRHVKLHVSTTCTKILFHWFPQSFSRFQNLATQLQSLGCQFLNPPMMKIWMHMVHVMIMLLECYDEFDYYMVVHFETPTDWSWDYACKILKPREGLWKPVDRTYSPSWVCSGDNLLAFYLVYVLHVLSACNRHIKIVNFNCSKIT